MLQDYFDKTFAQALSAGYRIHENAEITTFNLKFDGFNEKMEEVVDLVVKGIKAFNEELDQSTFETKKAFFKKRLYNNLLAASTLNNDMLTEILTDGYFSDIEIYNGVETVAFENFQQIISKYFSRLKINVLVHGNMTKAQALKIANILQSNIACDPLEVQHDLRLRSHQIPLGVSVLRVKSLRMNDDNSYIKNVYQFGPETLRTGSLTQLIVSILNTKAFDYLRTKEQLGYSVGCRFHDNEGIIGINVLVASQEKKHPYMEVLEKMETFMNEIAKKTIADLTDAEFGSFKDARIKILSADCKQLSDESLRHWKEIRSHEYVFDKFELAAKVTKGITKSDLQEFFLSFTQPKNMRKLSVQVIGNEENAEELKDREMKLEMLAGTLEPEGTLITNVEEFQSKLFLHPVVKFSIN